jgi:cyclohexadienyl dehydratase
MARSLGKHLRREAEFVKTTWPTLSQDLAANKFDIAMGGISDNPDRRKQFLISDPILEDGKVPLARSAEIGRYSSLNEINQPQVRVVENAGGTNLKFAEENLKSAKLIVVKDNKETIDYLLQNKADVMITDRIEAFYRQKTIPGLSIINPENLLTKSSKVYLIGKSNIGLLDAVNQWIKKMKESEQIILLKKQWLPDEVCVNETKKQLISCK